MRAYSKDLRQKIVEALEHGTPKAQAARLFGVCLSSVKRYSRIARQRGSLSPKKGSGRPPKVDEYAQRLLEEDVKELLPPLSRKDVACWSALRRSL
jgi:transposase